jgi:hypothetical protein
MDKRILEMNEPIEAVEDGAGGWVGTLAALDITATGATREDAINAAFQAMLAKLDEMTDDEANEWIESNSVAAPPGTSCSVP